MSSYQELDRQLTAPGQYYEVERRVVRGQHLRVWKNAPATLREVLLAGRRFAGRRCIEYQGEALSYEQHFARVAALASRLVTEFGIRPGERVALAMRNFPEWAVAFWAVSAIGAVVVPLNAWLAERELRHVLTDSGARLLVADRRRADVVAPWLAETAIETVIVARGGELPGGMRDFAALSEPAPVPELPAAAIGPDDDATIFYTSGTTGLPKGALGTQRNICSALFGGGFMALRACLRNGGSMEDMVRMAEVPQTGLLAVPFFHVTGCVGALLNLYAGGGRLMLMHKWDPGQALECIERERVNFFIGVPTMAWQLLEHPAAADRDLSSLNSVAYGGAPAAPELFRRLHESLPHASPSTGYGITEASSTIASFAGADYGRHPEACGAPLPVCELRFTDQGGNEVPHGALGEIRVRGPGVVKGYWNNPEATARAFRDGWFRTGDLGRLDDEGLLYIVDRIKDMIIRGGENIYCAEVEAALLECPGVHGAAVIGVPHRELGEEVGAVLQVDTADAAAEASIRACMAEKLAAFKQPARYWLRTTALSAGATGKILKRDIKHEVLG